MFTPEKFMKPQNILIFALAAIALNLPVVAHGYNYDQEATSNLVVAMIVDLGGHDLMRQNNGKTIPCSYGGTKRISVEKNGSISTYSGLYSNCRENGSTRDGSYEIIIDGDEIIRSSSKRSNNGELFDAAMQGDAGAVRKLIKARADVNYTESIRNTAGGYIDEWSSLMSAVVSGKLEIVKMLVKAGAWVNQMNSLAVNALWIASNRGDVNTVKYLLKNGGYANNKNYEDVTPLMAASMNGHTEVVRTLIAAGAKLDFVHNGGDTALMFALGGGHTAAARLLIQAGAKVTISNQTGLTALHIAAAEGNREMVRQLVGRKADIAARTHDGRNALDIARAKGHTDIAELLAAGKGL